VTIHPSINQWSKASEIKQRKKGIEIKEKETKGK
jgi:hypothetical protein